MTHECRRRSTPRVAPTAPVAPSLDGFGSELLDSRLTPTGALGEAQVGENWRVGEMG